MEKNKSVPPYKLLPDTVQTQWATLLHAGKFLANGPGADKSPPCRKPHVILLYGSSGFCNMNNVELQNRRLEAIKNKMSNVCILHFSWRTNGVRIRVAIEIPWWKKFSGNASERFLLFRGSAPFAVFCMSRNSPFLGSERNGTEFRES